MPAMKFRKVVGSLPPELESNTLYMVRAGAGVTLYISDYSGETAKKINVDPTDIFGMAVQGANDTNTGRTLETDTLKTHITKQNNNTPIYYDSTGVIKRPKVFTGVTSADSDGRWSIDYTHVGFTKVIGVSVIGEAVGTALADKRIPCIYKDALTVTSCNGYLSSASSAGLLAAMTLLNGNGGRVFVTITGY